MIVVRPEGSEVSDLEFLTRLERLEEHIKSYSEDGHRPVGHVESLLDVARESWRALHGNQGDFYRLPETKRGAKDVVSLFQMSSPERTARLVTVDQQTMSLEVHLDWMMGERYRRFVEYVEQGIGRFIGDVASTRP